MLHRESGDGLLVITQPAHSWLSGEIARAWGNDTFDTPAPFEETCLGAGQHDCGWLDWERHPAFNEATGRPRSFLEVETPDHIEIWTRGPGLADVMDPYAGLLVSLHGTGLYTRYRSANPDPDVKAFMDAETSRQNERIRKLAGAPHYAPHVTPEALKKNQALLAAWDYLSLHFCMAGPSPRRIENVPSAGTGTVALTVTRTGEDAYVVDPWPFAAGSVEWVVSARRLPGRCGSAGEMIAALEAAPVVALSIRVERAGAPAEDGRTQGAGH